MPAERLSRKGMSKYQRQALRAAAMAPRVTSPPERPFNGFSIRRRVRTNAAQIQAAGSRDLHQRGTLILR